MKPFIVQIAIAPKDIEKYTLMGEEEQSKLINPIDSEIIAIGVRVDFKNHLFILHYLILDYFIILNFHFSLSFDG